MTPSRAFPTHWLDDFFGSVHTRENRDEIPSASEELSKEQVAANTQYSSNYPYSD
jgi:hypothetical protein